VVRAVTAKYTWSAFQHEVLRAIEAADRSAPDFFVRAPITIDSRDDTAAFRAIANVDALVERNSSKRLRSVNELRGAARQYANAKLRERYDSLDAEARQRVRSFLQDWMAERGRAPNQEAKEKYNQDVGIEIAPPIDGLRLQYDAVSLMGVI
jgi:hypothetical protein